MTRKEGEDSDGREIGGWILAADSWGAFGFRQWEIGFVYRLGAAAYGWCRNGGLLSYLRPQGVGLLEVGACQLSLPS